MAYSPEKPHISFGEFRYTGGDFSIPSEDRRQHVYVLGKTGTGKSTLLENLMLQDIHAGRGICLIDPHGDLAQKMADAIPKHRLNDTIYFDASDREFPIGFNPISHVEDCDRELVASGIVAAFKGIWLNSWGEWLEYLLKNTVMAMLEYPIPRLSLAALPRMLLDPIFRDHVLQYCQDPEVKQFWTRFFNELSQRAELDRVSSTLNKAGKLTLSPTIRNILGQTKSGIDFKRVLDGQQILIVNLSKGLIGADNANLLGSLIVSHIVRVTNQRAAIPEKDRVDHYLYIDEFQNFTTQEFENILSESRKFRLSITMSHQYQNQISQNVMDAVLGNVGMLCLFSTGPRDAEHFAQEFTPIKAGDLMSSSRGSFWARFTEDGEFRQPQNIRGFRPTEDYCRNSLQRVIKNTRVRFATSRAQVEETQNKWRDKQFKRY